MFEQFLGIYPLLSQYYQNKYYLICKTL